MTRRRAASAHANATAAFVALALARGAALFFGLYSLANAVATALSAHPSQNLWWIDLHTLPPLWAAGLGVVSAVALVAYGLAPAMAPWRRGVTLAVCLILAGFALQNVTAFYRAWGAGGFRPGVPVPLSSLIAVAFALLGWATWGLKPTRHTRLANAIAVTLSLALFVAAFPLAQIAFFGTSDYRAKSDAAVIFGAQVYADGAPSPVLQDRVRTGVELYKAGLVKKLVMSGAVGASKADEPESMARFAEKAGVPAADVLLDHQGWNTDDTVANTTAMFRRDGIRSVLAVSQGYHLPRVKLAYLAAGWNVRTVPAAPGPVPITGTPLYIAREVPAFWTYWARAFVRDLLGR